MKIYQVKPGSRLRLKHTDADDHRFCEDKEEGKKKTEKLLKRLDDLQEKLYTEGKRSLLIVLQGMDTAGKDGTIRHVMSGVNPQSCQVTSFKVPTAEEEAHDFLWRVHQKTPPRGFIGIFNRSHYEDVLVTRVHRMISDEEARRRFKEIRHFEMLLSAQGTVILKFFLHISRDEQKARLQERADDPGKRWKLSLADLAERKNWKKYQKAYEEALSATSTPEAPWYVIPANHKWYSHWLVAGVIVQTLEDMRLATPKPDPAIHFKKLRI